MQIERPRITARIAGYPLHPLFRPFVIGYFVAAGGCDLVYSQASTFAQGDGVEFVSITQWLLVSGLIAAGLAAIVDVIDLWGARPVRHLPPGAWLYAAGAVLVVALELGNLAIRHSGGAAAIMPMGLLLSLSAIAVLLAMPSRSWAQMHR